jgi:hypothetical protein
MIDRERILIRVDHLQQYLRDLRTITPPTFEPYQGIEKQRACERLLQPILVSPLANHAVL